LTSLIHTLKEIVLSAKRVPKIKAGENLSHASNLEANTRLYLPESLESPSTGNHPSSKDEVITATSDEHKQKDIEEAKIAPKKEPPPWYGRNTNLRCVFTANSARVGNLQHVI